MDGEKLHAILEWEVPKKVSELLSFLGSINYFQRLISSHSARATPLIDLLKKKVT